MTAVQIAAQTADQLLIASMVTATTATAGCVIRNVTRSRSSRRRANGLRVVERPSERRSLPHGRRRSLRATSLAVLQGQAAIALVTALVALALLGPFASIVGFALVVSTRRTKVLLSRRRSRARIEESAPDTVELFVLLTHAGLTPVQAVRELSSTAPDATRAGFAAVVRRIERGEPFADALAALPARLDTSMVGLADTVASADRYGSPLAPMLESLALEARAARRRRNEADARRLPIRLSFPLVLCTLPSFVLLAIAPAVIAALSSISVPI